jgi:hypothetical protein
MTNECPWESRIARAAQDLPLAAAAAEHVAGCESCQGTLSVAVSLHEWAAEGVPDRMPGARFLWLAAQERLTAERAAWMQVAMLGAALLVLASTGIAAWKWQLLSPGANTGGIAAALVIAVSFANWFAGDNASPIQQ